MTSRRLTLERFEFGPPERTRESADYERGVRVGKAEAEASLLAHRVQAAQDVAARLQDMTFSFAEARQHLLDRFAPIILQVSEAVLPEVLKHTYASHMAELINQNLREAADIPLTLQIPPEAEDLKPMLDTMVSTVFSVEINPDLASGQAELSNTETQIFLDLAAFLDDLQTALRGVDVTERSLSHG